MSTHASPSASSRTFLLSLLPAVIGLLAGCGHSVPPAPDRIPPNPNAPALYSNIPPPAAATAARARPDPATNPAWRSAPFSILHTELSPATLVHASTRYLGLFCDLPEFGLGAPAHVAWATKDGPRTFAPGQTHDVTGMEENWLLVWFAGATNWTNWDSPWAVFLQHKASWLRLDERGLHLEFPREAGDVVMMPLYGYFKPPPVGRDYLAEHGLPSRKIRTWEWEKGLARDPLTRLRFWAGATREFPIRCDETFSVDRGRDSVTFRSRFTWHSIPDDWGTRHVKLAPLSPTLGLVAKDPEFPVRFSMKPMDMELPTPFGPYLGVQDVDSFNATLSVLQYVNESEASDPPDTNAHPTVAQAVQRALDAAIQWARNPILAFDSELAAALPFLEPTSRSNTLAGLRRGLAWYGPQANPPDLIEEVGLFAYFAFTHADSSSDRAFFRERWREVKVLPGRRPGGSWAASGPESGAEVVTESARAAAFARLAWLAGDADGYEEGAARFARATVHLWAKQRGADWFRKQQPWHSLEWMDDEVFLTELRIGAGWSFDGPKFPATAVTRAFEQRWRRCNDPDVARFCREYLKEDVRRELNWLQARSPRADRWEARPGGRPSFVQLRSLLLNESPAELAKAATPEQFTGLPAGIVGSCLGVLRASRPARLQRLIPGGPPSPFVAGLERDVAALNTRLVTHLDLCPTGLTPVGPQWCWPQLTWPGWGTPTGAPWTFGRIKPVREGRPASMRSEPLNENTTVVSFAVP